MITLYDCATAPSPRRARILLAEKGIAHETVEIDLRSAQQLSDSFRAINPRLTVPALKLEDGHVLTDNAGIAAWAEAFKPEPPMLGRTALEKAEVASWNSRIEGEGFMAIAEAFRNSTPAMKDRALPGPNNYAQIPELAERGIARLTAFIDVLDAQLSSNSYVAGADFSLADITAIVAIDFARIVRMKPTETHTNIARWRAQVGQRPACQL
jgi:glutathione S-transferase